MQICPNCNQSNRIGVVFCEHCGASLIGDAPLGTKSFGPKPPEVLTDISARATGAEILAHGAILRLEIEGAEPILLKPKRETVFGRRDPATGAMPDVDLTPFAGYRMGVSRKHAAIRRGESDRLELWDLGSSNGTYLNGVKLAAHRPNKLHDGDEIRLGQMVMRLHFHQTIDEAENALPLKDIRSSKDKDKDIDIEEAAEAKRVEEVKEVKEIRDFKDLTLLKESAENKEDSDIKDIKDIKDTSQPPSGAPSPIAKPE